MAAHAVTLRLPASLYDRFSSRAERAQRSLEAELLEAVATIAAEEEESSREVTASVAALELLSDAELKTIDGLMTATQSAIARIGEALTSSFDTTVSDPLVVSATVGAGAIEGNYSMLASDA